ncbi:MAG: metallophosphoesterase [Promethearchaeota archaeon]
MDTWLIPCGVVVFILYIVFPIVMLVLTACVFLLFAIPSAWNAVVPPNPYITVAGGSDLVVNWFFKKNRVTRLIIWNIEDVSVGMSIAPYRCSRNVLGSRFSVASARVSGLLSGTMYRYDIVSIKQNGATDRVLHGGNKLHFTVPSPGWQGGPMKIAVFGDMQPRRFIPPVLQWLIMRGISKERPDLIVYLGDFTMNGNFMLEWAWFFRLMGMVACSVPFLGVPGNHDGFQRNPKNDTPGLEAYRVFMDFPGGNLHYSLMFGGIKFIALEYGGDLTPGSPQNEFITAEIEGVPIPGWLVVLSHHGPYNTAVNLSQNPRESLEMREHVVPVIEKFPATWWGGHEHAYQRYTVNDVPYITTGATSSFHHHDHDREHMNKNVIKYHFTLVEVTPEVMHFRAISLIGRELDEFILENQAAIRDE